MHKPLRIFAATSLWLSLELVFSFGSLPRLITPNQLIAGEVDGPQDPNPSQDRSRPRFYIAKQDEVPLHGDFYALKNHLKNNPQILFEILETGVVRLIVDKTRAAEKEYLDEARTRAETMIEELFEESPIPEFLKNRIRNQNRKISIEFLEIDSMNAHTGEPGYKFGDVIDQDDLVPVDRDPKVSLGKFITKWVSGFAKNSNVFVQSLVGLFGRAMRHPIQTLVFFPSAFWKSRKMPTLYETAQGLTAKAPGMAGGTAATIAQYGRLADPAPLHEAVHVGLGLGLATYHGVFVTWWMKYQDRLAENGLLLQSVHNFFYGQLWPTVFMLNAWGAGMPNAVPSLTFFAISISTALFDAPITSLKFQGLSKLVSLGAVSQSAAATFQVWISDTVFTLQATNLGMANYAGFGFWYTINQMLNLGVWATSQMPLQKPTLIIVDEDIADMATFRKSYSYVYERQKIERTPLRKTFDRLSSIIRSTLGIKAKVECSDLF